MHRSLTSRLAATAPFLALVAGLGLASTLAAPASADTGGITATPGPAVIWADSGLGPQVSMVLGDMSDGPHLNFFKFPGGMATPVHAHSHDYTGIVIAGVMRHYAPGERDAAPDLPAGSVWSISGNFAHISECMPGADCIALLYQTEAFDFLPR